jgi:cellulose synthase/poly-beta-1,6-N-acetylglucosamine synthase-like glycosyltransferase
MSAAPFLAEMFWIGLCATLYAYLGFPALVALLASKKRGGTGVAAKDTESIEAVTIVISAYNEEQNIEAKIRNVLAADYPRPLLDILVVSDASTDRTDDITRAFEGEGVRLVVQETRRGKTAGLNRAIGLARREIVIFTDANAAYPPGAIGILVRYFRNPKIGLVTGYTRYALINTGHVAEIINVYTFLERVIKRAESKWGCCVGADGAIFAMRRSLYRTLRDDNINDFVIPLGVIDQGYQCVLAEDAFCSENPGKSLESEFRRQSRITNRTLRALWRNAHLLNPFRFPLFSFFLFSHKVVRFLVPGFLMLSTLSLLFLAPTGGVYLVLEVGALLVVVLAALSKARPLIASTSFPGGRLLHFLNIFLMINIAVLHGWWRFLSGFGDVTWQHDRSGR